MEIRGILSRRIEEYRKNYLHMTQEEMAIRLGMEKKKGRSTINNWEQGAVQIKSDDLLHLGKTFDVSVDWLLGLTETPSINEDMKIAQKTTGLSGKAIQIIRNCEAPNTLSKLIEDPEFKALVTEICILYGQAREAEEAYSQALDQTVLSPTLVFTGDKIQDNAMTITMAHYRFLIMRKHETDIQNSFAKLISRIADTSSKLLVEEDDCFRAIAITEGTVS